MLKFKDCCLFFRWNCRFSCSWISFHLLLIGWVGSVVGDADERFCLLLRLASKRLIKQILQPPVYLIELERSRFFQQAAGKAMQNGTTGVREDQEI
jgi:hypothetical protein